MGAYNCREVWWGYTFVQDVIPDDVLEEWLPLDLLCVSFPRAETAVRVTRKKLHAMNTQRWPGNGATENTANRNKPSEE